MFVGLCFRTWPCVNNTAAPDRPPRPMAAMQPGKSRGLGTRHGRRLVRRRRRALWHSTRQHASRQHSSGQHPSGTSRYRGPRCRRNKGSRPTRQ